MLWRRLPAQPSLMAKPSPARRARSSSGTLKSQNTPSSDVGWAGITVGVPSSKGTASKEAKAAREGRAVGTGPGSPPGGGVVEVAVAEGGVAVGGGVGGGGGGGGG